jgi:hypothetical protein
MTQLRKLTSISVLLAGLLARLPVAGACAVCLSGGDPAVADAYDWSVLFLMATPYLVMGSIAGYLVYAYRRSLSKKEQEDAAATEPVHLALDQKESGR